MKVKMLKTGEILEVTAERANYWMMCKLAVEVKEVAPTKKTKKTKGNDKH